MVEAIVATAMVVAIVIVVLVARRKKSGGAAAARGCPGCGRNLLPEWTQCPFCGTVAHAVTPGVGGSWTVQPGQVSGQLNGSMNGAVNGGGHVPGFAPPPGYQPPPMTLPPPSFSQPGLAMSPLAIPQARSAPPIPGVVVQPGRAVLEFIRGPLVGRVLPLAQATDQSGTIRIGSDAQNSIVIPDPAVSRRHAAIRLGGQGYELADLGSSNGIYVNGQKVARHFLAPGDVIRLGGSEVVFRG